MLELSQEDREVLAELCRLTEAGELMDNDREALRELAEVARRGAGAARPEDDG